MSARLPPGTEWFVMRKGRADYGGSVSGGVAEMNPEILRRYVALKIEEARLKNAIEKLKPEVVAEVDRMGGHVGFEGARLVTRSKKVWDFSAEVDALALEMQARRKSEIEGGIARLRRETRFVIAHLPAQQLKFRDTGDPPPEETEKWLGDLSKEHPRAYSTWSDDEVLALQSEFAQGSAVDDLAELLQRQPGGIRSKLRQLGLVD